MTVRDGATQRISVAGLGAVGKEVVRRTASGVPGFRLSAVASRDHAKAQKFLRDEGIAVPVVTVGELEPLSDVVVECAPADALVSIAEPMLRQGKEVIVLSAGALLDQPQLLELAEKYGGRISIPTGALVGLDAVGAAAEGCIHSVRITSSKPTRGLSGAPYLERMGIVAEEVQERTQVFSGTAREAVKGFPANLNVAVALALAGIGPDATYVDVWIDPALTRNTHLIEVESDAATMTMKIANVPTENPRTGRITALSVISLLRKRNAALVVGS